jgi:uncharacterized protein YndB with AHSA1/START domain
VQDNQAADKNSGPAFHRISTSHGVESANRVHGRAIDLEQEARGRFSAYGGRFTGIVVDLAPGKRVVQAWQSKDFPAGIFSMATFNLVATSDGGTQVTLTHRGVPKELIPTTERIWRDLFWERMKRYLKVHRRD